MLRIGQRVRSRSHKVMFRERPLSPSSGRLQDDSLRRAELIRSLGLWAPISFARQTADCAVSGEPTTRVRPLRWNRAPSAVLLLAVANWPRKLPKFSGGQRTPVTITA